MSGAGGFVVSSGESVASAMSTGRRLAIGLAWLAMAWGVAGVAWAQDEKTVTVVGEPAGGGGAGQKWAFVVAVNNYEDKQGIGALHFSVADARLVYKALTDPAVGGFAGDNVVLLTDEVTDASSQPTRSNILSRLVTFLGLAGPDDTVLFFYSGHGAEAGGESYLLPIDAKGSLLALTSIPVKFIKEQLGLCKARKRVLITDACHSGSGKGTEGAMGTSMNRDLFEQSEGLVTLASCGLEEKSYEYPEVKQGAFTYFLVEGLAGSGDANGDGIVTATEANVYTWDKTRRWAAQRGLQQNPKYAAAVQGDIPLAGKHRVVEGTRSGETIVQSKAGKPTLAVVCFETLGVDTASGRQFAEELTAALVKTRRFAVVERSRVEALLGGQEVGGSAEAAALGKVAEEAGVQLVVCGSLAQEGRALVVNARLLEAASGVVSKSERLSGTFDALASLAVEVAGRIAAAYPVVSSVIAVQGGIALVDAGAGDGVDVGMALEFYREENIETLAGMKTLTEPLGSGKVDKVEEDVCRAVILAGQGLKPGDKARSAAEKFGAVELASSGALEVQTVPAGALLFLDGKETGVTPWTGRLPAREYQVTLRKAGYEDYLGVAKVEADGRGTYTAELKAQRGKISLSSQPEGATVLLDGEERGRTPITLTGISAGAHTVVLELAGRKRWEQQVSLDPGAEVALEGVMAGDVGGVSLSTAPGGAEVYLDGVRRGVTPFASATVPPGKHEIRVALRGYADRSGSVTVESGQTAALEWTLAPVRMSLSLRVDRKDPRYQIGQQIAVSFKTSENCYVYIYDVAPAGTVFRLFPNAYVPVAEVKGNKEYKIPGEGYRERVGLRVDGPAGQETFVAIASREPVDLGIVLEECGSYEGAWERLARAMDAVGAEATVERLDIEVVE